MRLFDKAILLLGALGLCQNATAIAAPCDAPEYRAFDFWLGEWQVYKSDGKLAGTSRIEREYGGCVLHERYKNDAGYSGESLNIYDAGRKVWHQTWVDNAGTLLLLDGGLREGKMVLEGAAVEGAKHVRHRITWTPNADGTVRQHWESREGEGKWNTIFDGLYRRK
jgi:hypothetical protein